MMTSGVRRASPLILAFFLLPVPLKAQESATGSIVGTVVDALTEEPLAEMLVMAWSDPDLGYPGGLGMATTSEDGSYRMEGLLPGTYVVGTGNEIEFPFQSRYAREYHADALSFAEATRVDVTPGDSTQVDFGLRLGAMVLGTVRDQQTGAPLEGVDVIQLSLVDGEVYGANRVARSGSDGGFVVPGLSSGEYNFRFEVAGYEAACVPDCDLVDWLLVAVEAEPTELLIELARIAPVDATTPVPAQELPPTGKSLMSSLPAASLVIAGVALLLATGVRRSRSSTLIQKSEAET